MGREADLVSEPGDDATPDVHSRRAVADASLHWALRWLALTVVSLALGRLLVHAVRFVDQLVVMSAEVDAVPWRHGPSTLLSGMASACVISLCVLVAAPRVLELVDQDWARRMLQYLRRAEVWLATALAVVALTCFVASVWRLLHHAVAAAWPQLSSSASDWARLWSEILCWTSVAFLAWWLAVVRAAERTCRTRRTRVLAVVLPWLGIGVFTWGLLQYLQASVHSDASLAKWASVFTQHEQRLIVACALGATFWLGGVTSLVWQSRQPASSSGVLALGPAIVASARSLRWKTTLSALSVAAVVTAPSMLLGSAFAWENAHPLAANSGPARGAACCPPAASDLDEAFTTQADSAPTLLMTEDVDLRQLEATLASIRRDGQTRVRLLSKQARVQERPILGPWRTFVSTSRAALIAKQPLRCRQAGIRPVSLTSIGATSSASWFREVTLKHGAEQLLCLLLPPIACEATAAPCADPRRAGWTVTDSSILGSRSVALRFDGPRGDHLAAFIPKTQLVQVLSRVQGAEPFDTFAELERRLRSRGRRLLWAMNGGMYMEDRRALGLLVSDGRELARVNQRTGKGNFYLEPNGVFTITESGYPEILTTRQYVEQDTTTLRQATQSGPIVLQAGRLNPLFDPDSTSRFVRNGVCVSEQYLIFDISLSRVSFHEFASFLRALGCNDALYLDGNVSSVYAPGAGRTDSGFGLGPIVVASEPLGEWL